MSGGGTSIGATLGGILGTGIGGAFGGVGAPIGGTLGSLAGSQIGGLLDKDANTPTQIQTNPMANVSPEELAILRGAVEAQGEPIGNLFVPAGAQQQGALDAMANFQGASTPAFYQGLGELERSIGGRTDPTIEGQYLDVANVPAFQNLAKTRYQIGQDLLGDALNRVSSSAAGSNIFDSSARQANALREARRVGSEAGLDVARAGFGQYGNERTLMEAARARERGFQEAAIGRGLALSPGLADAVFRGGEQLRAAEQAAGIAGEREQTMRQADQLDAILDYVQGKAGTTRFGPTPAETFTKQTAGVTPLLSGIFSGGSGSESNVGAWLAKLFGGGGVDKGFEGTVYAPSGGWATPSQQE